MAPDEADKTQEIAVIGGLRFGMAYQNRRHGCESRDGFVRLGKMATLSGRVIYNAQRSP